MSLLGIDLGTTHCKVGLFAEDGSPLRLAARPMPRERDAAGAVVYAPEAVWETLIEAIEAVAAGEYPPVAAIGIASMAETGLLIDRHSGTPRTPFLPWFDATAAPHAARLAAQAPEGERFPRFGIYPSSKCSLAKILRVREEQPALLDGATWLSVADYTAYRLTGVQATDYSLAGRTHAFALPERAWATDWLRQLDLPDDLFPPALPGGTPLGTVADAPLARRRIAPGTPVAIAGHDHVCAAFGAGVAAPGQALDSMGTAEVLIGALAPGPLGAAERCSGLTFGIMPPTGAHYWLGGLSSSGGSLDWLRGILGEPALTYEAIQSLQQTLPRDPGDLLYLPYLAGSGAPLPNPAARGAFIGLAAGHTRADLLRAVFEGTAYQLEAIRRAAGRIAGHPVDRIVAAGGGTRNPRWLQIKADVYGVPVEALAADEAALLGAALIAGVGCGVYRTADEALAVASAQHRLPVEPDAARHRAYAARFEQEFEPWQRRLVADA
jgi:sugar (pentulose or hexulose) kinase